MLGMMGNRNRNKAAMLILNSPLGMGRPLPRNHEGNEDYPSGGEMEYSNHDMDNTAGYQFAAQQIINSVKQDDCEGLIRALKSFVNMCHDEKMLKG